MINKWHSGQFEDTRSLIQFLNNHQITPGDVLTISTPEYVETARGQRFFIKIAYYAGMKFNDDNHEHGE